MSINVLDRLKLASRRSCLLSGREVLNTLLVGERKGHNRGTDKSIFDALRVLNPALDYASLEYRRTGADHMPVIGYAL